MFWLEDTRNRSSDLLTHKPLKSVAEQLDQFKQAEVLIASYAEIYGDHCVQFDMHCFLSQFLMEEIHEHEVEIHAVKEQAQLLLEKCPSAHRIPGDIVRLTEKYDQLSSACQVWYRFPQRRSATSCHWSIKPALSLLLVNRVCSLTTIGRSSLVPCCHWPIESGLSLPLVD